MKTWTVVIEVKDDGIPSHLTKKEIERIIEEGLRMNSSGITWQIFECTEAPYGPQGVVLEQAKKHVPGTTNFNDVYEPGRAGRVQTAPKDNTK